MGPLIIAIFLGLAGILIVVQPLLGLEREPASEAETPGAIAEVAERERLAKQTLRELDLDYRLGNLDNADYETLHDRYERRALAAIKVRYQREQELDSLIERQLATLRQQDARRNGAKSASRKAANRTGATAATTTIVERVDSGTPDANDNQEPATTPASPATSTARSMPSSPARRNVHSGAHASPHTSSVRDRRARRKGV